MGHQITGVKPGEAKITITSTTTPGVTAEVPVTVTAASDNLLRYGPVTAKTDGDNRIGASVAENGALTLTGSTNKTNVGIIQWPLDTSRLTPNTVVTISMTPPPSGDYYISMVLVRNGGWVGDSLSIGMKSSTVTLPADLTGLAWQVIVNNKTALPAEGVTIQPQLEIGDTAHTWVRPDVTDATDGSAE